MDNLFAFAVEAHGRLRRWNEFKPLKAVFLGRRRDLARKTAARTVRQQDLRDRDR